MNDLVNRLTNFIGNIQSQANAVPDFAQQLVHGTPYPDLQHPQNTYDPKQRFGVKTTYPVTNQFMGKNLVPFTPQTLPDAIQQRVGLLGTAINTGGFFDPAIDTAHQVGFAMNRLRNGSIFPEPMNNNLNSGLGEKSYSQLNTPEAQFNYLKTHPTFTPPEWTQADTQKKATMPSEYWPIYQMFAPPHDPRVRTDPNVLGTSTENTPLLDLAKRFLASQSLVPSVDTLTQVANLATRPAGTLGPLDPGSLYGNVTSPEYQKAMGNIGQGNVTPQNIEATSGPLQGFIGDIQPITAAAHLANTVPMKGSIEQILESQTGWKPGMRQKFDVALMNKDAATVKQLLPDVPQEYKTRFAAEIKGLIGDTPVASLSQAVQGQTPMVKMYVNQVRNGAKNIVDLAREGVDQGTLARILDILQKVPQFPHK